MKKLLLGTVVFIVLSIILYQGTSASLIIPLMAALCVCCYTPGYARKNNINTGPVNPFTGERYKDRFTAREAAESYKRNFK